MKKYLDNEGSEYHFSEPEEGHSLMTIFNQHGQIVSEASIQTSAIDSLIRDTNLTEIQENEPQR